MLRYYWNIVLKHHLKQIVFVALISTVGSFFEVAGIGLLVPLIGLALKNQGGDSAEIDAIRSILEKLWIFEREEDLFLALLAIIIFSIIFKNLFDLVRQGWLTRVSVGIAHKFRKRLFLSYLKAPYIEVLQQGRGAIIRNIEEVSAGIELVVLTAGHSLYALAYVCISFSLLLYLSWWATIGIGSLAVGGVFLLRRLFEKRAQAIGAESFDLSRHRAGLIIDAIDGVRLIKTHNREDVFGEKLSSVQDPLLRLRTLAAVYSQASMAFFEILGILLVGYVMSIALLFPALGISLPVLAAMAFALRRLQPNIANVNSNLILLGQNLAKVQSADMALNRLPQEQTGGEAFDPSSLKQIRLDALSFYYPGGKDNFALRDINLTFRCGEVTALVGKTGAGKTTIADLLARLYEPIEGCILADERDIRELNLSQWRRNIGYVGQDPFLFNGSFYENISLWEPTCTEEDVERVARIAHVHDFVESLGAGYDSMVGDRGLQLSGGQRQRVSIARALLHNPSILIFDEATSALDNLTEQEVHEAISRLRESSTVIVIAHRLRTVQDADLVVVLDRGRVIEVDSHQGLIDRKGHYFQLYAEG